MGILIRPLEPADYPKILALIANELGYKNSTLEELSERLDLINQRKDFQTLVAAYDNQTVGFIGLQRCPAYEFTGEYLRIVALAVQKEYQHRGIGAMLIEAAEQYAHGAGIKGITLDSGMHRVGAHAFYEKMGFDKGGYQFSKFLDK